MDEHIQRSILEIDSSADLVIVNHLPTPFSESSSTTLVDCVEGSSTETDTHNEVLVGMIVKSLDEAYNMYNDHAFRVGFSVRKVKERKRVDGSISMKKFLCSKAGKKLVPKAAKSYNKFDVRTNCGACIQFDSNCSGSWVVTSHKKEHNHSLCPSTSSHLLGSHRKNFPTQFEYLKELKKTGVGISTGFRLLKNQSGGSPLVGFTARDVYNALQKSNTFNGSDSNTLIQIFKNKQANEDDFFFDCELDSDSRLCSFFWRDGRMLQDYNVFGDLLVHDTTYRTNKYDMICGPFVGMNHHCKNVMFGCGFLMNERIESFEWLFRAFFTSMKGKHPTTIMTDQSAAMAAAITKVFPMSRHRLCVWHIGENSKANIRSLRSQKGFVDIFNHLLKNVETEAEFQFYWDKMIKDFRCQNNSWLLRLYEIRAKWCPAFSKDWVSGGILSSQRSESTNHALTRKLSKTDGLCDFYNMFLRVVSEWRSKENGEDIRCLLGKPSMVLNNAKLVSHARDIYTIEDFSIFEDQFIKGATCHQFLFKSEGTIQIYHVSIESRDLIKHVVTFDSQSYSISCTCKMFFEVGILCCHCLRIWNIHCVSSIPEIYIRKRWRKDVIKERVLDEICNVSASKVSVGGSLWTIQMNRKFQRLILASEKNTEARLKCEEAFKSATISISNVVGAVYVDDCVDPSPSDIIQNPQSTREKGKRNKREKSVLEKKYNQCRVKRIREQSSELDSRNSSQFLQDDILRVAGNGYMVHTTGGSNSAPNFTFISPSSSSNIPPLPRFDN